MINLHALMTKYSTKLPEFSHLFHQLILSLTYVLMILGLQHFRITDAHTFRRVEDIFSHITAHLARYSKHAYSSIMS